MEQAFVIPQTHAEHARPHGWTIWTFTDLDWHLLRGMPAHAWLRRYRFASDVEEAERLLADCERPIDAEPSDCAWAQM